MLPLLVVLSALVGLAVGSFLNVVIWRVPRGESVIHPASGCPACGTPIAARDNVPVVSWLLLRGRCRTCREPISRRYPLVEAATAVAFAVVTWWLGPDAALPAYLYLAAISIALTLIDIDVHRLPNAIVLPSYLVAGGLLAAAAVLDGDLDPLTRAALGGAVLYAFYFVLVVIYPAGMGFGDVKLAGLLGLYLGFLGWAELLVGAFAGFLVGGLGGAVLLLSRRAGRKSRIPFGPYMLVGAWLAVFAGDPLADLYLGATGLR